MLGAHVANRGTALSEALGLAGLSWSKATATLLQLMKSWPIASIVRRLRVGKFDREESPRHSQVR